MSQSSQSNHNTNNPQSLIKITKWITLSIALKLKKIQGERMKFCKRDIRYVKLVTIKLHNS